MSACDYSSARPGGAALQAAGITAVGRYLAGDPNYAGALGPAEFADLQAHNIAVWVNYEGSSTGMLGGYAAGVAHGQKAAANLVRLGLTVGTVRVFASADFDVQVADFPACDAYMDGFISVLGDAARAIYGGMRIINHFRANGRANLFWKSAASSWDHGETGFVHIEQTTAPSLPGTDNDIIYAADFGQIGGASLAGLGATPFNPNKEDDMTTISSPNRGIGVVGPGYFHSCTPQEAAVAPQLGPVLSVDDATFDLFRSLSTAGDANYVPTVLSEILTQTNAAVAQTGGIHRTVNGADVVVSLRQELGDTYANTVQLLAQPAASPTDAQMQALEQAIVAAIPAQATPDQIATAVRAAIAANPLTGSPIELK